MATVTSTLKMFDAMTGPLKKITQSLNMTLSAMEQMQRSADKNLKVDKTLSAAKRQLASAEASITEAINQSAKAQEKLNKALGQGGKGTSEMLDNVKSMAAAYLTFAGAQSLFQSTVGAAMEQQQIIDTLAARAGSQALGQYIYDQAVKQALRFGQDVNAALSGTMSFMSSTMNPEQLKELNVLAMRLSKLNPAEGLEGAAFALKELMAGDYTSIAERFNISRSLLQDSAARNAGLKGDIEGFIKGMDQLLNQQNLTQEAFEKMLDTPAAKWNRAIQTFRYNLERAGQAGMLALQPMIEELNKAFESNKFQTFFNAISSGLRLFGQIVSATTTFVLNNLDLVKNALLIIGVAITVLGAQWFATWAIANWPILAIIGALTLLLTILNKLGISTGQVVGFIAGLFAALFTYLRNSIAFWWDYVVSIAEFLANLFVDPVYAIQKLFYDMLSNVMGYFSNMINGIVDGLNWLIQKINEASGSTISAISKMDTSWTERFKPTSNKDVFDFSRFKMGQKDIGQAFDAGFKWGAENIAQMQSSLAGGGWSGQIPNIAKVGEVGKIRDTVDISSEDLRIMRELSEMNAIQNFVSLTPTVQITGDNHFSNGYDIDTVISRINQGLEEEIASSARMVLNV